MKAYNNLPTSMMRRTGQFVSILAIVVFVSQAGGQVLNNNNSSLTINTGSGVSSWMVDAVNQMNQQWFWYRIGGVGPEAPIQSISATPTVTSPIPNKSLDVTYANATLSVDVTYTLGGGTPGTGNSTITESVHVKNLTAGNLDLHFFQYSDLNLINSAANQVVSFSQDVNGNYIAAQTLGNETITEKVISGIYPVTHVQADSSGQILASLTDGGPTTLTGVAGAGPSGDASYGYQWDATLAPSGQSGETLPISILVTIVPEPSVFGLVSVATLLWFLIPGKKSYALKPVDEYHS